MTYGVVIDEKVVHSGGIPSRDTIAQWLDGVSKKQIFLQIVTVLVAVVVNKRKYYAGI